MTTQEETGKRTRISVDDLPRFYHAVLTEWFARNRHRYYEWLQFVGARLYNLGEGEITEADYIEQWAQVEAALIAMANHGLLTAGFQTSEVHSNLTQPYQEQVVWECKSCGGYKQVTIGHMLPDPNPEADYPWWVDVLCTGCGCPLARLATKEPGHYGLVKVHKERTEPGSQERSDSSNGST